MTEAEMRQQGLQWENIERYFLWNELSKDFIRQLVEYDPTYKTQLEHHIIMALNGYASYPSTFYQNVHYYLINKLAEQKQLVNYADRLYLLHRQQAEKEFNSRQVYKFVDGGTGKVLDTWVW